MEELDPSASDPRVWFAIVRRRWPIIVGCAVVVTALLVGLSATEKKVYEAKATLLLEATGNLSVSVIVGQIRSTAADLLAATGMSYDQSAGAVRDAVRSAEDAL